MAGAGTTDCAKAVTVDVVVDVEKVIAVVLKTTVLVLVVVETPL